MSGLRVALFSYEFPPLGGGMGKAVRAHAEHLAALGATPAVVTARYGDLPREEERDGVRILRVPALRRRLAHANTPEVLSFAAGAVASLPWLLRRFRPDVSVAYLTIPSGPIAEAMRLGTRAPWICFLRGQDVPGYPDVPPWMHTAAWPLTSHLWRRCAAIASPSVGLAELARRSRPGLQVERVPNGVDVALYRPRRGPRRPGPVRVLFAGRLVRFKGVATLLDAWSQRPERAPAAELWIAGSGRERRAFVARAQELGIRSTVRFLGRLDEQRLAKALRAADLFVHPSEAEGLPNAVLEAMASGLPVVLSAIGPHRELLAAGGGVLVEDPGPRALGDAIERLIRDPRERGRLGEEARGAACSRFDWRRSAEGLLRLCERVAEGG